jgi:hypothetical protein
MKRPKKRNTARRRPARRNQEGPALIPMGEYLNVEAVRFNEDGSADVVMRDSEIAELPLATASQNPRRRKKAKAKNAARKRKGNRRR